MRAYGERQLSPLPQRTYGTHITARYSTCTLVVCLSGGGGRGKSVYVPREEEEEEEVDGG